MRFVLATANPDKVAEIEAILGKDGEDGEDGTRGDPIQLVPRPAGVPDVVEDGETLVDNARLKAEALCTATGLPAIADDTGLEVDALGGGPGVHAARFAGPLATYDDNVERLLGELESAGPGVVRTARFRTVAMVRYVDGTEVVAEGVVEGQIAGQRRGSEGFGYDPVFVPDEGDGRTFAEMTPGEKHAISHRGRAFRSLRDALRRSPG